MSDDGEDRRAAAREAVWRLVREQPGLADVLSLGDLVARHRHPAGLGSEDFWVTDWESVLQDVESASDPLMDAD